nr:hypothetical protein Iba_chr01bCG13830 [Ipomoea batatas]
MRGDGRLRMEQMGREEECIYNGESESNQRWGGGQKKGWFNWRRLLFLIFRQLPSTAVILIIFSGGEEVEIQIQTFPIVFFLLGYPFLQTGRAGAQRRGGGGVTVASHVAAQRLAGRLVCDERQTNHEAPMAHACRYQPQQSPPHGMASDGPYDGANQRWGGGQEKGWFNWRRLLFLIFRHLPSTAVILILFSGGEEVEIQIQTFPIVFFLLGYPFLQTGRAGAQRRGGGGGGGVTVASHVAAERLAGGEFGAAVGALVNPGRGLGGIVEMEGREWGGGDFGGLVERIRINVFFIVQCQRPLRGAGFRRRQRRLLLGVAGPVAAQRLKRRERAPARPAFVHVHPHFHPSPSPAAPGGRLNVFLAAEFASPAAAIVPRAAAIVIRATIVIPRATSIIVRAAAVIPRAADFLLLVNRRLGNGGRRVTRESAAALGEEHEAAGHVLVLGRGRGGDRRRSCGVFSGGGSISGGGRMRRCGGRRDHGERDGRMGC